MRHLNRGHQRYLHFCYGNLEDPHPSAHSLKFKYENLEDRQKYISFSLFKKFALLRENVKHPSNWPNKRKENIKKDKIRYDKIMI